MMNDQFNGIESQPWQRHLMEFGRLISAGWAWSEKIS
jgi:hypothetical protein